VASTHSLEPTEQPEVAQAIDPEPSIEDRAEDVRSFLWERLPRATDVCVTCSFQASGVVLLHLLRDILPDVPVLFVDTGYHFAETLAYRDRIASAWGLNLINVLPERTVAEQESAFGILNRTAPDRCCALRKVEPLFGALQEYKVWITGLRRDQAATRANLRREDSAVLPTGHRLIKLNPLANWANWDVWQYAAAHDIPLLPLYEQGYGSIGCAPCTSLPVDANDPRSGRWGGQKLECGIHFPQ
jgi:phosphoadenosine phosphosulfate reductase